MQAAWLKLKEIKQNTGDKEKIITTKKIEKSGEHNVKIFLSNRLETSFLEKVEKDVIQYLRKELDNDFIDIEKEVTQVGEIKKLYTSNDIYAYMVEQNPKLKDLKEKLGLDFDY